ncbi:hypothetical protein CTI12_AA081960 [Artemisia annua]|uniref:Uncharacterized protein n=1 Tax=Artemisia annua TaxID=35608 RepID=A0A2U1Q2H9_ARTAN|nr:hypothetical protein CTI12_AA081960 [Artemisia annua]
MNPNPDDVTFELNQLQLSPEVDDDVKGEEFTFMCRNEKTAVPLFDQTSSLRIKGSPYGKRCRRIYGKDAHASTRKFQTARLS